ncbi:MAG: lysophospholipid acyltransferase family protein [Stackebrandtia sp.]
MELVYPPVILAAKAMFKALGLRINVQGAEHIPDHGGAVIACTHHSYLDFIFCGFGAQPAKRLVRFMAKKQVFDSRIAGPLMRGMRHIPVDRSAGKAAYDEAVDRLRRGEVVGVFPEATISRSFTVKELKSGSVRMATDADVPIVPMAVWGTQRLWTKGRPRKLAQRGVPISIRAGSPFKADEAASVEESTEQLRTRMQQLLDDTQAGYPAKPADGEDPWWLPSHLGGTAPTPEAAAKLDSGHRDED